MKTKIKSQRIFQKLKRKFKNIVKQNNFLYDSIVVEGQVLSPEEAIGCPDRKDFALVRGKEKLIQAKFKGSIGQAFTNMPGEFKGKIKEIIERDITNNYDRAILISVINAVLNYLGLIKKTVHCKNNEPENCANRLNKFIKKNYQNPKILLVGLQHAFFEKLITNFNTRVIDLDEENIGTIKKGVKIETGNKNLTSIIEWSDLIIATGSTLSNGTISIFVNADKEVLYYGTTAAGAAYLLNLKRFCINATE